MKLKMPLLKCCFKRRACVCAVSDPMHGPRRLQVVDIESKQLTVRWEPFGYNVTRCYSYNLTVQYRYTANRKEETREETCYDTLSSAPLHTIRSLPPYTNVSIRLLLRNREGVKDSQELQVLTDEDGQSAHASHHLYYWIRLTPENRHFI